MTMKPDLAAEALKKIRDQESTIAALQARLAEHEGQPLSKAVDNALQRPATPDDGRNAVVSKIVREGFALPRDITKARKTAADKKAVHTSESLKARGVKPSKFTKDGR
jgi:hypothetical protein